MESSWYYARYCSPQSHDKMLESEEANYWLPVDQYIGGIEHAILHLLYARFFHKLLRDAGLVKSDEPFKSLLCQGMVLADAYYYTTENGAKEWVNPADVTTERDEKGKVTLITETATGRELQFSGMSKMSKSKNNGVDPQAAIDLYGADTVRLYTMFAAPPEQTLEWSDAGVQGAKKFLERLWRLSFELTSGKAETLNLETLDKDQKAARRKIHETIAKVTIDMGQRQTYNTAIAAIMELLNALNKLDKNDEQSRAVGREGVEAIILMLAPITPHITHELWIAFGHTDSVLDAQWPIVDETALIKDSIEMVVQVNGKVRAKLELPANVSKEEAEAIARTNEAVIKFIGENTIRKVIVIPGKLVNIVAN
jgi:leucyl-tRNA synthetase